MPNIPEAPYPTVVPRPQMNPAEAAKPWLTVAEGAEKMTAVSYLGEHVFGMVKKLEDSVEVHKTEMGLNKLYQAGRLQISQTGNYKDLDGVTSQIFDGMETYVNEQVKDPYLQSLIGNHTEGLKADLQYDAGRQKIMLLSGEAKTVLKEDAVRLAGIAGNPLEDPAKREAAKKEYEAKTENYVMDHAIFPYERDSYLRTFARHIQGNEIGFYMNSPDPAVNAKGMELLSDKTTYPEYTPEEKGHLTDEMKKKQRENINLTTKQDVNKAITAKDVYFASMPGMNDDYAAQLKQIDNNPTIKGADGEKHPLLQVLGATDATGLPKEDVKKAIIEDIEQKRTHQAQGQADQDKKALDKYDPMIDEGRLTTRQIDQMIMSKGQDHISEHAGAYLKKEIAQKNRQDKMLRTEERVAAREEAQDKNDALFGHLLDGAVKGHLDPDKDIYPLLSKGLKYSSASELVRINNGQVAPGYKDAVNLINKAAFWTDIEDDRVKKAKMAQELKDTIRDQNLTGPAVIDEADKLLKREAGTRTGGLLDSIKGWFGPPKVVRVAATSTFNPDTDDYDTAGALAKGYKPDPVTGHMSDWGKGRNYITFSDESHYSDATHKGGHWTYTDKQGKELPDDTKSGGTWHFKPSAFNLTKHSIAEYIQDAKKEGYILEIPIGTVYNGYKYKGNDQWDKQ